MHKRLDTIYNNIYSYISAMKYIYIAAITISNNNMCLCQENDKSFKCVFRISKHLHSRSAKSVSIESIFISCDFCSLINSCVMLKILNLLVGCIYKIYNIFCILQHYSCTRDSCVLSRE